MKYKYQIQIKEYKGDKWFATGHTLESLLICRRKEITKGQYYAQKELNEIYYNKSHETGDVSLLSKCKIIMEKDGKLGGIIWIILNIYMK